MGGAKSRIFGSTLRRPSESSRSQRTRPGTWNLSTMLKISGISVKQSPMSSGRGDDAGIVAEGRAEHLPQVALLGFGGHAGGRARALAVDDDDGNLRHGGEAEGFGHEGESAAGGGAHGADAGVGRADGHVDDADFVFDLADHDAGLAAVRGHPVQHAGGGAHGIGAVEFDAGRGSAHGQRGVAAEDGVLWCRSWGAGWRRA